MEKLVCAGHRTHISLAFLFIINIKQMVYVKRWFAFREYKALTSNYSLICVVFVRFLSPDRTHARARTHIRAHTNILHFVYSFKYVHELFVKQNDSLIEMYVIFPQ